MIQTIRTRMPFMAAGLALALSCAPTFAQAPDRTTPSATKPATSQGKQTTMTGKVVDLHQFMTGERTDSRGTPDRTAPDRTDPADRNAPTDRTTPGDKSSKSHVMKNEIMGLETTTGLVLLCFKDAPGIYATPRADDRPSTSPNSPTTPTEPRTPKLPNVPSDDKDRTSDLDSSRWMDKQVQVSGTIYEKNGIKFLVVTKVSASADSTTTPRNPTTPTTPPTPTPAPGSPRTPDTK